MSRKIILFVCRVFMFPICVAGFIGWAAWWILFGGDFVIKVNMEDE